MAQWASYQTWQIDEVGYLPVAFFLAHWGDETGYGGSDWTSYHNPGNQASACGVGTTSGHAGNGDAIFTTYNQGLYSYASLLMNGYPHVQHTYTDFISNPNTALNYVCSAIGKGYEGGQDLPTTYCWSGTHISSSSHRIWAAGQYNSGCGSAGCDLWNIISNNYLGYNYTQRTNPNLAGFLTK
jgi:hypothetical protein